MKINVSDENIVQKNADSITEGKLPLMKTSIKVKDPEKITFCGSTTVNTFNNILRDSSGNISKYSFAETLNSSRPPEDSPVLPEMSENTFEVSNEIYETTSLNAIDQDICININDSNDEPLIFIVSKGGELTPIETIVENNTTLPILSNEVHLFSACSYLSKQGNNANLYIAKVWAAKLEKLHPKQKLFAEKAINDILFEAEMGQLQRHSVRINEYLQTPPPTSNSTLHTFNLESGDVLKSKWRGLRDNFRKELAKTNKGRSGDSGEILVTSKWPYFTMMLFLKDNMTQRNATGNIPPLNNQENLYDKNTTPDTISESDYDRNHNYELNSDPELNTEIIFTTTPKAAKIAHTDKETGTKGKKAKSSIYEKMVAIEEEKLKAYKEKCKERPKEEDSDFHFFMSLMPYMKKIPEDQKLSVRIKIQQVLLEAQQHAQSVWTRTTTVDQKIDQSRHQVEIPSDSSENEVGCPGVREYLYNFHYDSENDLSGEEGTSTGKTKIKKLKYTQKYRKDWEDDANFRGWLRPGKSNSDAYCTVCNKTISIGATGKSILLRHKETTQHIKLTKSAKKQQTLTSMSKFKNVNSLEDSAKQTDIYVAAYVTEHNISYSAAEHLPKLIEKICPDSEIAKKMKCGRTKVSSVVKNVIGKQNELNIINILKTDKFSLIVDESTDRSCTKHLALVCKYLEGENERSMKRTLQQSLLRFFPKKGKTNDGPNPQNDRILTTPSMDISTDGDAPTPSTSDRTREPSYEFDEKEGGSVAVVHQNWLTPRKKEVYWPPYKTQALYDKAVKKGDSCTEDWQIFRVKRIFRYYAVQDTSSHTPRSSTSSCISYGTLCNTGTSCDTPVTSVNVERNLESNAESQSSFQTKLVSHLALIIEQNKEILSLLKNRPLIEQSSVLKPNVPSKYLGTLDKNSVVSATNSALRCCLAYKVAKNMSFLGSRNNKKAFNNNILKKVIVDSVKLATPGSTTRSIEDCMKTWLKRAPKHYKLEQIKLNRTDDAI
ncbi:unnamed protein product [Diabrotica balteata]|uniref:Uncharacterized protein n=1 Tax=Diabrotica balteata TaxID=107213 RepID=A0A9N9TDL0_DIABA|nr:unnamed protein product [Diabrotica balteata]